MICCNNSFTQCLDAYTNVLLFVKIVEIKVAINRDSNWIEAPSRKKTFNLRFLPKSSTYLPPYYKNIVVLTILCLAITMIYLIRYLHDAYSDANLSQIIIIIVKILGHFQKYFLWVKTFHFLKNGPASRKCQKDS